MLGTGGQTMQRLIDANALNFKKLQDTNGKAVPMNDYIAFLTGAIAAEEIVKNAPTIDTEPVVRCKDCIYWQDRKVRMENGEYRDYLPDEDMFVSIDKGINVGSHCTLHGYENMPGSWFWAKANDFCSNGKRKKCAKMDEE